MTNLPAAPLGFAALPGPLRARIEAELGPGERLLWAAQPDPDRSNGPIRSDYSFAVWMLSWGLLGGICLAVSFVIAQKWNDVSPLFLLSVGVLAEMIAFLMATSYLAAYVRRGPRRAQWKFELYAVTDRRAMIWQPDGRSPAVSVRQYPAGSLRPEQVERLEHPDGTGSLLLNLNRPHDQCFADITDVRRVDELVRHYLVDFRPAPFVHAESDPDDHEEPF